MLVPAACGLWPFIPATLMQRAMDDMGMAPERDSPQEVAQLAAERITSPATHRSMERSRCSFDCHASVNRSVLHTGAAAAAQPHAGQTARGQAQEYEEQPAVGGPRSRSDKYTAEEERHMEGVNKTCRACLVNTSPGEWRYVWCQVGPTGCSLGVIRALSIAGG